MNLKLSKARRQDYIYQALRGRDEEHGLSISEIGLILSQNGIEVNERTIRRDLEELSNNHGLCDNEGHPLRFFISADFEFKHKLNLNEETLQVLFIALNNLKATSHEHFEKLAGEAEIAILNSLPTQTVKQSIAFKENYYFDFSPSGKPASDKTDNFKLVLKAIRSMNIINCKNISPYKEEDYNQQIRSFAPLKLILSNGTPYLLVQDMKDKKIKKIRASRLSEVEISTVHFTHPDISYDLKNALGGWGGTDEESIDINFTCTHIMATYFLEKSIHKSQSIEKIDDDLYRIKLHCAYSKELSRLLSSFGGNLNSAHPQQLWQDIQSIWSSGLKNAA